MHEATMGKTQSAPPPTEKFDRLKAILREMFQLDRGRAGALRGRIGGEG